MPQLCTHLHQRRYESQGGHDPLCGRRWPALFCIPGSSRRSDLQDHAGAYIAEDWLPIARTASTEEVSQRTAGRQPARYVADD